MASRYLGAGLGMAVLCASVAGPAADGGVGRARMRCDRVLGPPPPAAGGEDRPLERFIGSLRPGQTGCLRSGTYSGDVKVWGDRLALRAYPGAHARILGRVWFSRQSHDDLVEGLQLDGRNPSQLPSPTVNGSHISFVGVDVTNHHTNICFDIGSPTYGRAEGTVIAYSRIHDCGRLPADNTEHGIYVAAADRTRIVSNLIYDNADRAIQLYPDAQHSVIEGNVIDGNGEGIIFSGEADLTSSHNVVRHNVISNSRIRADVESWYPSGTPAGVGNVVRENCLFGRRFGEGSEGFSASANVAADPHYLDRARADFRLARGSRCAKVLNGRA